MSSENQNAAPAPEKPKSKKGGCLPLLLLVVIVLCGRTVWRVWHPAPEPPPKSEQPAKPAPATKPAEKPKPAAPVPAPRRIVSNAFSEAHSAEAIDYAIGFVQEKHPQLKKAVFEVKNAGCVYFSDGTFDVSSWCDWKPQGQSVSVRSFFSVTMSHKNGEWFASNLKMSGWGF